MGLNFLIWVYHFCSTDVMHDVCEKVFDDGCWNIFFKFTVKDLFSTHPTVLVFLFFYEFIFDSNATSLWFSLEHGLNIFVWVYHFCLTDALHCVMFAKKKSLRMNVETYSSNSLLKTSFQHTTLSFHVRVHFFSDLMSTFS